MAALASAINSPSSDRRAHQRVPYGGVVVLQSGSGGEFLAAGIDLSESGIRLRPNGARAIARPGTVFALLIGVSDRGWMRIPARLLRFDARGGWALAFEDAPREAQRQLRRLIELLLAVQLAALGADAEAVLCAPTDPASKTPAPEPVCRVTREVTAHADDVEPEEGHTRDVLPEVMADLASKDPTRRLPADALRRLLTACAEDEEPH